MTTSPRSEGSPAAREMEMMRALPRAEMEEKMAEKPSRAKVYAMAEQVLRERHEAEFQALVAEMYAEHGYTYKRRLSAEERAERERREALVKAVAKRKAAEEEIAALEAMGRPQPVEDSVDEFAGSTVRQDPYGAAHPVDPEAVAKADLPLL